MKREVLLILPLLLGACQAAGDRPGQSRFTPAPSRLTSSKEVGAPAAGSKAPASGETGMADKITQVLDRALLDRRDEWLSRLVQLSLACVDKEYPNKPEHVLAAERDLLPPRRLHPAFFGCFDWHSAVHGHWAMVRALRASAALPEGDRVRAVLDRHLSEEAMAGEARYLAAEQHRLFERPYGWGWLLRLGTELQGLLEERPVQRARRWRASLLKLEWQVIERILDYLQRLSLPVRAGTHHNTAFAMVSWLDYARKMGIDQLQEAVASAARRFYLKDRDCPVHFEPSGEDFLSPCLAEVDLMRRVLSAGELRTWLSGFLPAPGSPRLDPLLDPPEVLDPKDPKIGHLIGLYFHRAWVMEGLRKDLGQDSPWAAPLASSAARHRVLGFKLMFDSGYGGEHWLASFAIYLLTGAGEKN